MSVRAIQLLVKERDMTVILSQAVPIKKSVVPIALEYAGVWESGVRPCAKSGAFASLPAFSENNAILTELTAPFFELDQEALDPGGEQCLSGRLVPLVHG